MSIVFVVQLICLDLQSYLVLFMVKFIFNVTDSDNLCWSNSFFFRNSLSNHVADSEPLLHDFIVKIAYLISSIRILCSATNNSNESWKIPTFFFVNFWIRMPSHNGLQHSKKKSSKSTRFIFSQRCYDVRNIRKDTIVAQQRTRKH